VFSFVVDGECEFWYIQLLKQHETLNINLEPKLPQKKKMQDQFNLVSELAKESEKVFWIVDFDVINKETKEGKRGQKSKLTKFKEYYLKVKRHSNIVIIVNNPCLEYWFLQHFEETSKYFETYEKLEKSLKNHLPTYEKTEKYFVKSNPDIYKRLKPKLQEPAIPNSEKLGEFDFDKVQTGITEMYKVFRELGLTLSK